MSDKRLSREQRYYLETAKKAGKTLTARENWDRLVFNLPNRRLGALSLCYI